MKIIIANSNPVHAIVEKRCVKLYKSASVHAKRELNLKRLKRINPDYVFFLHWSHIIPADIFNNFNCVLFHMTDLPYGRGGSPLQNLIVRGHTSTVMSAIKVEKGIDAGPIYLKRRFSLKGSAEDIFLRAGKVMVDMIDEIINEKKRPIPQKGKVFLFKRRSPDQSNIAAISDTKTIYNYIRMLDAVGYPKAFLETNYFKFEFSGAKLVNNGVVANVKMIKK